MLARWRKAIMEHHQHLQGCLPFNIYINIRGKPGFFLGLAEDYVVDAYTRLKFHPTNPQLTNNYYPKEQFRNIIVIVK